MSKQYVLVDHENVQPTSLAALNRDDTEVMVFVGASQKSIGIDLVKALQPLGARGQYLQISGNGKNALDFHIAYYLGVLANKHPGARFVIVSKDTGFDPLIAHLVKKDIACSRTAKIPGTPASKPATANAKASTATATKVAPKTLNKAKPAVASDERLNKVIERLTAPKATKPRTRAKLASSINALFQKQLSEAEVAALIAQLTQRALLRLEGEKVIYP
jgi:hypothetical protein